MDHSTSFLSQSMEIAYGLVLDVEMVFKVYVHRGVLHHSIVICDEQGIFERTTLELTVNEDGEGVPLCQIFKGPVEELEPKAKVRASFRSLCTLATAILDYMGEYRLFGNNCQNFCNYFLECIGAEGYTTAAAKAGIAAFLGGGIGGIVLLLWGMSDRDERQKPKEK